MTTQATTETVTADPEAQVTTTPAVTETPPEPVSDGPKELRESRQAAIDENKELRKELMGERLDKIGLDITEGLGKAIAKEYDGPMDMESVSTFARDEYGHDVAAPQDVKTVTAQADKVAAMNAGATPVTPPTTPDAVQQATEAMNAEEGGAREAKQSIAAKIGSFFSPDNSQ